MKNFRNFTIWILLIAVTMTQSFSSVPVQTVHAQTGDVSGNGGAVFCRNGARDYGNFLSAVISYDGFKEYWKDIIVRYNANMCLFLDIDNLLNRIDKARQQIRNAFYSCDSSAPKLATTYYQLEAELYFIRKYVDVSQGLLTFTGDTSIHSDFIGYVVNQKHYFNITDGETLFTTLLNKYQARQSTYINCSDPTWGNLIQKWNEFKSTAGGFSAIQDSAESISKSWDSAVNTPFKRSGDLFGGLLDTKINGLDPATGWGDIAAAFKANAPSTGANVSQAQGQAAAATGNYAFSFSSFLQATTSDADLHDQEKLRAQYLAQYQQTYQASSSSISKEIIDRVNYLDNTIKATYDYMNKTATCAKGIIDKTCSG